ncbi:cytosolic phospholipase A2 gamma [Acrasis kona]|uniref:Cytosolic phospholipase A2 gamma n=1 Tax=Acrasis kona TaxID=1008807 RepID=A0AAW2ZHT6_9EUKA
MRRQQYQSLSQSEDEDTPNSNPYASLNKHTLHEDDDEQFADPECENKREKLSLEFEKTVHAAEKLVLGSEKASVGVCFSGGGIRSASFVAGVLQTLAKEKVLEKIGYISAVSGGGYTSSALMTYLTANECNKQKKHTDAELMDQLVKKMRKNCNYLMGNTRSLIHFLIASLFGISHNLIYMVALAIVVSSFIFSGYRAVTYNGGTFTPTNPNGYRTYNSTNLTMMYENMTNYQIATNRLSYQLISAVFFRWTRFYSLEFDIADRTYTSGWIMERTFWIVVCAVLFSLFSLGAIIIAGCHYNVNDPFTHILFKKHEKGPIQSDEVEKHSVYYPKETKKKAVKFRRYLSALLNDIVSIFKFSISLVVLLIFFAELLKIQIFLIGLFYGTNLAGIDAFMSIAYAGLAVLAVALLVGLILAFFSPMIPFLKNGIVLMIALMIMTMTFPLGFVFICARFSIWYMLDNPIDSIHQNDHLLYIEFIAWCYICVELFFFENFNSAIHMMYRMRLREAFFCNGQDVKFNQLTRRHVYLCNTTLNNFHSKTNNRLFNSFVISQLYIGGDETGYYKTKGDDVSLSYGTAVSGAALALNLGQFDALSSISMRFALQIISANLGSHFRIYRSGYHQTTHAIGIILCAAINISMFFCACIKVFRPVWSEDYINVMIVFQILVLAIVLGPPAIAIFWEFVYVLCGVYGTKFRKALGVIRNFPVNDIPIWNTISQVFGIKDDKDSRSVFLSDAGHFDMLGLYELLRRNCTTILCFDGGEDYDYVFRDLYNALSTAKYDGLITSVHGEDLDKLTREMTYNIFDKKLKHTDLSCTRIIVTYCSGAKGYIYLGKATVSSEEELLVKLHILNDTSFPHLTTINQLFTPQLFDAYRMLGKKVAKTVVERIKDDYNSGDKIPSEALYSL